MSINHDGFDFGHKSDLIRPVSPPEPQIITSKVFGLVGEFHVTAETWGRDLTARLTLDNYANLNLLQSSLDLIQAQASKLTGDVVETTESGTRRFPSCTFLGGVVTRGPFFDGSGVYGWVAQIQLFWRQRKVFDVD